jgi:hypothetical protein
LSNGNHFSGDYLLSPDLNCGGGNGITITSSAVTLKLEGHRITAGVGATNYAMAVFGPFDEMRLEAFASWGPI